MSTTSIFFKKGALFLKYTHNRKHVLFSTGIKGQTKEINFVVRRGKKQVDKASVFNTKKPGYSSLNGRITEKLAKLEKTIFQAEQEGDLSTEYVKQLHTGNTTEAIKLIEALQKAGDAMKKMRSKQQYVTLINHLEDFENPYLASMDFNFYNRLLLHLRSLDMRDSTIDKQIKVIKSACKRLEKTGTEIHRDIKHYQRLKLHYDKVYLYQDEVEILHKCKLKKEQSVYRDMFVLHCFLGLRISDFKRISKDWISGNILTVQRQQKSQKPIHVPLNKTALQILKKYDYKLPARADQVYNRYIKKVCEKAKLDRVVEWHGENVPLYSVVSSKTAKKTFATYAISLGLSPDEIEVITGTTAKIIRESYRGELAIKGIAEKMGVKI